MAAAVLGARVLLAGFASPACRAHALAADALAVAEQSVTAERGIAWLVSWARVYLARRRLPAIVAAAEPGPTCRVAKAQSCDLTAVDCALCIHPASLAGTDARGEALAVAGAIG